MKMVKNSSIEICDELKPYLDEISERLLTGHATVMVGAGFSKNAAPVVGVKNRFPNWNELGELFYEKVYGSRPSGNNNFLNPLKLAEEVEVMFGRAVLDDLLIAKIPDNSHKPTSLFTKLLQLEWRDVFTTNFDTLLERAKDEVSNRNYQVVTKKEDIINSKSPRIIKLHGSFPPTHTQFTITEEDYRIYPKLHAPFVNTVHQALLETTLCLIGFSGDDPNFLRWIGWIRDQYSENTTSKIYLVVSSGLPESQIKFLHKRNVNIVNFEKCPEVGGDPSKAIELFVDYLTSKKFEEYRLDWPNQVYFQSSGAEDKLVELENVVKKWKSVRKSYPGWRIVPKENRKFFRYHYQDNDLLNYVVENLDELNQIDINFVYEYCWQLDRNLLPIFDDRLAKLAEACLDKYQPNLVTGDLNSRVQRPSDLNSVNEQWVQLSIYMLRHYREEGLSEKWIECESKLTDLAGRLSEEQLASLAYERLLQRLFQLDLSGLNKCLDDWPSNQSLPFFEAKRAGILAEIGRTDDALEILETSLNSIRKKQNLKPVFNDYTDVSDEAYLMLLLQCVKQSSKINSKSDDDSPGLKKEHSERLNHLLQFKCDPFGELSKFDTKLSSQPVEFKTESQSYSFRVGNITTTRHYSMFDHDALAAYSFLRFCEDAGLPYRMPGIDIGISSAKGSLQRIRFYSPHWALITLLRTGDAKVIKEIYNREYVLQLSNKQCDEIIDNLMKVYDAEKNNVTTHTIFDPVEFGAKLIKILPTIFSRLCCKVSSDSKQKLLDFIVEVYSAEPKRNNESFYDLVQLLFDSVSIEDQLRSIPQLLQISIPEELDFLTERYYPNPFTLLRKYEAPKQYRKSIPNNRITYFIDKVKSKDSKKRDWAIATLGYLSECNLLNDGQRKRFAKVARNQTDSHGFPQNQIYFKHFWLDILKSDNFDLGPQIRSYIANFEIPIQSESPDRGITIGRHEHFEAIANELAGAQRQIQFDLSIYEQWLKKITIWWDSDKKYLQHPKPGVVEEFRQRFSYLIAVMAEFVVPGLSDKSQNTKEKVESLVSDLSSHGLPTAYVKVASTKLLGYSKEDVILEIRQQLTKNDDHFVRDAIFAAGYAVASKPHDFNIGEQRRVVTLVLNGIIWGTSNVINPALDVVIEVITKFPNLIDPEIEKNILLALDITANLSDLNTESTLELEEKLSIRRGAARLAYELYSIKFNANKEIPQEILKWKKICESEDEFAEVRIQWDWS